MIGFIAFRTLIFGDPVRGWPSMACIIFLVGGIQLFCIGILGEYLAKICDENLTYEDLGEINRYFRIAKGFYTRQYGHFEDACTETLNIAIKA